MSICYHVAGKISYYSKEDECTIVQEWAGIYKTEILINNNTEYDKVLEYVRVQLDIHRNSRFMKTIITSLTLIDMP